MKKSSVLACLVLGLGGVSACGVSIKDSDRQLVYQNQRAGELVEEAAQTPALKQAGHDIAENSKQLVKVVGLPQKPLDYSPENSAAARAESVKAHMPSKLTILLGIIGGGLLAAGGFLARVLLPGPLGQAISAVLTSIGTIKDKAAAAQDGKVHVNDVIAEGAKLVADPNVGELVRAQAAKLGVKLG